MIKIYGLKTCDTCRKARKWLEAEGIAYEFLDFREAGLDAATLDRWIAAVGWESLLNRRGTTWRRLAEAEKEALDAGKARELMLAYPALVKRPVIEAATVTVGWGPDAQAAARN